MALEKTFAKVTNFPLKDFQSKFVCGSYNELIKLWDS